MYLCPTSKHVFNATVNTQIQHIFSIVLIYSQLKSIHIFYNRSNWPRSQDHFQLSTHLDSYFLKTNTYSKYSSISYMLSIHTVQISSILFKVLFHLPAIQILYNMNTWCNQSTHHSPANLYHYNRDTRYSIRMFFYRFTI